MADIIPSSEENKQKITPLRCLLGAAIASALATALYFLTSSIAAVFAAKPINFDNQLAFRISTAVRTLVLGMATLGTFIFAFVAGGLILLAIQLLIKGRSQNSTPS